MLLWHLLRLLRICPLYPSDSGDPDIGCPISFEPLDPIDVAGSFIYQELRGTAPFVDRAIATVSSPDYFDTLLLRKEGDNTEWKKSSSDHTNNRYAMHLQALSSWGVTELVLAASLVIVCRYFAVAKSDQTSRSIFDGRNTSSRCVPPPPLNLPDTAEITRFYAQFPHRIAMAVWDYRHYFHQIALHGRIREYFGVTVNGKSYRWQVLPMGWNHSPAVAQSLALGVAIQAIRRAGLSLTLPITADTQIPAFLEVFKGEDSARFYVTYDNVCILGATNLVVQLREIITQRCRELSLHIKPGSEDMASEKQMLQGARITHLGVTYGARPGSRTVTLSDKLKEKWLSRVKNWKRHPSSMSNRQVACGVGMILHAHRALYGNLIRAHKTLNTARVLGSSVDDWNALCTIPRQNIQEIIEEVERLVQMAPVRLSKGVDPEDTILIAADASKDAGGFVYISRDGTLYDPVNFNLPVQTPIFLKEVIAARHAVVHACSKHPASKIVLLEDNTAAAIAIERGWSSNEAATKEIVRLHQCLSRAKCVLVVKTVAGTQNPADEPSRRKLLNYSKAEQFVHLYHTTSYCLTAQARSMYSGDSRTRHTEDEELALALLDPAFDESAKICQNKTDVTDA